LQQVFNKIWENKTVFDFSKEHLISKMIKIARDTAWEVIRMGKTNFNGEIPEPDKTVYFNGIGNPLPEQNNAMGSALLFNMEKTSKEALDLIYFKGYSFTDAATVLNIPLSSLKEKVKMAIKELKVVAIS
jgi:DNA-directed RNA polymerase specialized sigma24 family protein